ncbi:oligopeptide transport system permease protein OppB [Clostridia bacterium]|nr:oligopeptide transport system permease protein OppB [Clostridia bacterium]
MKAARYIVRRLLSSMLMIFLLITISFFLVKLIPGSPFTSEKMQAGNKEAIYAYYGLDKPVYVQYFVYLVNLLHGDLGTSYKIRSVSVNQIIASSFPYSLDLGLRAIGFALTAGLLLGIIAAYRRGKAMDTLTMLLAIIGTSVPSFIVGFLIQYLFAVKLKWFPVAQYETQASTILPTFALGLGMMATIAKYTRTSMLEVISSDFVKTANAKGISKSRIIFVHQLRNALMPIVTLLGPMVASVITGTFVVENVFAIPGLGRHYVTSVQNLDYTLIMGLTIFFAVFLVLMNLAVDILYAFIDPRIQLG